MFLECPAFEQRMMELMLPLAPQLTEAIVTQLPQKRCIVGMPKILRQQLPTELLRDPDDKGGFIRNPSNEITIIDILQHGVELYDEARCLHPSLRTAAEHSQLDQIIIGYYTICSVILMEIRGSIGGRGLYQRGQGRGNSGNSALSSRKQRLGGLARDGGHGKARGDLLLYLCASSLCAVARLIQRCRTYRIHRSSSNTSQQDLMLFSFYLQLQQTLLLFPCVPGSPSAPSLSAAPPSPIPVAAQGVERGAVVSRAPPPSSSMGEIGG